LQTAILRLLRPTSLYFTCTSAAGHILTCHSMPHQKCLFLWRSRPPTSRHTWFLTGPIPVYIPIGISISSSVFAELSRNQQPDRPCYSVCSNRPHSRDLHRMRPKYLIKQVFCCFVFNMFTLKPRVDHGSLFSGPDPCVGDPTRPDPSCTTKSSTRPDPHS